MRILHYSHDTYGLGHIRRSLAIAEQVASDFPHASQLLISGTPQPHCFSLPHQLDFIKLPNIDKPLGKKKQGPDLLLPFKTLKALRENIILEAIKYFKPHIVLVDKAPAGMCGEMLPSLHYLQEACPDTKLVLGMSDIEDNAMMVRVTPRSPLANTSESAYFDGGNQVRDQWRRQGIPPLMENRYDLILHYGNRMVYDPVSEYRLSRKVAEKMITCGYIGRRSPTCPPRKIRHRLKLKSGRLVVVTAGGGEDGFKLIDFYLNMLALSKGEKSMGFDSLIIPGPLMSPSKRRRLQSYQSNGIPFTLLDSTPDMFSYLKAADLVISMGGYNSLCEILSLRKRAIIIPHTSPRVEQLIRAGRLAAYGLVEMIHPNQLTPSLLLEKIGDGLMAEPPATPEEAGLNMNGAQNASRALAALMTKKTVGAHRVTPPLGIRIEGSEFHPHYSDRVH
ncbi:MAG: glycosyltransferase family protein [Nitrospiria bacterium]